MNCVNHPDIPVAAYCQNCGKALCSQCVRSVSGVIYCEQCLAAKLGIGGGYAAPGGAGYTVPGAVPGGVGYAVPGVITSGGPNPGTATVLGFIPGVGAMYNGQFVKALVHVLVFVILIGITEQPSDLRALYRGLDLLPGIRRTPDGQGAARRAASPRSLRPERAGVKDRHSQLARDAAGDPDIHGTSRPSAVRRLSSSRSRLYSPGSGLHTSGRLHDISALYGCAAGRRASPSARARPLCPRTRDVSRSARSCSSGWDCCSSSTRLGVFRFDWFGHTWPILIIVLGAWLLFRRTRGVPPPPPPPAPPAGGGQ